MSAISQADMDRFPIQDWKYDVASDDTKLGYEDWVKHNVESAGRDCPHCSNRMELVDDEEDAGGDEDHWSSPNGCHSPTARPVRRTSIGNAQTLSVLATRMPWVVRPTSRSTSTNCDHHPTIRNGLMVG